jgi:hypothetical protein
VQHGILGEPKVAELHQRQLVLRQRQQRVGQLDVARDLALAVAKVEGQHELLEQEARQRLGRPADAGRRGVVGLV